MYSLSVLIGDAGTVWTFQFKTQDAAKAAVDSLNTPEPFISLEDDFGSVLGASTESVKAFLLTDLGRAAEADIDRALIQARAQAKLQSKAGSDPALRFLAPPMRQGGPSFMT